VEQRAAGRQPVDLDAVVVCPRFGLLRAVIVDLGPGGVRVRAETNIVPIGAEVSVSFRPDRSPDGRSLAFRGSVVHQSVHGFGIRFCNLDPEVRRMLARLLEGGAPLPVARASRQRATRGGLVDA
jgi:hypothetical protein